MNKKNKCIIAIISIFGVYISLLFIDYFNVLSKIGLRIDNLNAAMQGIITSAFVPILLFLLTFMIIERWNVRRQKNQFAIAVQFLNDIYDECKDCVDLIHYQPFMDTVALEYEKKKEYADKKLFRHLAESPFEKEDIIIRFCSDGVLTAEQVSTYYMIKTAYKAHVGDCIVFYKDEDHMPHKKEEILELIEIAKEGLI